MDTAPIWPEVLGYLAYLAAVVALAPLGPALDRLTGATLEEHR